jgi:hypothetical protein
MTPLRSKLIRLAYEKPDLRPHILPLVRTATEDEEETAILVWDARFDRKYQGMIDRWEGALGAPPRSVHFWADLLRKLPQDAAFNYSMMSQDLDFRGGKLMDAVSREKVDRASVLAMLWGLDALIDKFHWTVTSV